MNSVFRRQFRQRPVSRQSRHRHLCLEFRTVLLALRSHLSLPFQPVSISLANCPKKRDRRKTLRQINTEMGKTTEMVGEITHASYEQQSAMTELAQNVERVSNMTEQNVAVIEQTSATVTYLDGVVMRMRKAVTQYRV